MMPFKFKEKDSIYKYVLEKRLGNGSFGEVWLAKDTTIDKEVALKILPSDFVSVIKNLEEAKNGNKVKHPNLLDIFYADVVTISPDVCVALIAQEYQKNGTVETLLNAHNFLPLPKLLKILTDVLLGLEYLHNGGVIHNDIKPSNILLDEHGNGVLADYGISSFSIDKNPVSPKSIYIIHGAPETLCATSPQISVSTDIYQLGCTAYRLVNGISEIKKDIVQDPEHFVEAKIKGKIPSRNYKPYVPKKLAAVINKAIDVNPQNRYASAIDMKHALEKLFFPGFWTTNPTNISELIGYGNNYSYTYKIIPKANSLFDFFAYQTTKNNKTTQKHDFCKKNITTKEKDKLLKDYFEWVINNAK